MKKLILINTFFIFLFSCEGKRMDKNSKYKNRLADSQSPYLLQHAYNPVDWYQWSEEAFEKAKEENKPIFLSTGMSYLEEINTAVNTRSTSFTAAYLASTKYGQLQLHFFVR